MDQTLWILLAYLLGVISGMAVLIFAAFWSDFKKWIDDLRWKFKMRKYR